jgi:hypothetical protein
MSFAKKVIVAVSPEENIEELLMPIREMTFQNDTEIHYINVFSTITYSHWLSSAPLIYPIESERKEIEKLTVKKLTEIAQETLPINFQGKIVSKCLFGENPKVVFSDYANNEKSDLIIVAKREKRGLFESSFASFVNNHTKANLLLLKEKD